MHSLSRTRTVALLCLILLRAAAPQNRSQSAAPSASESPQAIFQRGESELRAGKLEAAERDFQRVLAFDPNLAGAYANLGVIRMRRKQWQPALEMLRKAEKLAPEVPGIRLNIGLAYFRQNNFAAAIPPFESVVKQSPGSYQARYLLGLCYFLTERWSDAIAALEPLWGQVPESEQLNYLYVLDIAAYKAKNKALDEKAAARLVEVGQNSPAFHLLMGKAFLNRGEYENALRELKAAEQADPKLPFVHFNLGLTYFRMQDYEKARAELQKDLAIEPDVALTYEQLGDVEMAAENLEAAEKNYRQAVKVEPRMINSHLALAKIEEGRHQYAASLTELDAVIRLDKDNVSARYFRGQVLLHLGREKEGREELARAAKLLGQQNAAEQKKEEAVPSPELTREPE